MMTTISLLEEFLDILKSQNDIFSTFYEKQNNLRLFILKEDFVSTQQIINELDSLQSTISFLEGRRNGIYKKLKNEYRLDDSGNFELFLAKLETNALKKDIKKEYEALKLNVFSVQRLNSSIAQFIETKIVLVDSLLSEIYPQKKATSYAKDGRYTGLGNSGASTIIDYKF